jgi:predicted small metal-binding protein
MRVLCCRDVGFDCDGVVEGTDDEAVLAQAAAHAWTAHGVEMTPELAEQIRPLIRAADEPPAAAEGGP